MKTTGHTIDRIAHTFLLVIVVAAAMAVPLASEAKADSASIGSSSRTSATATESKINSAWSSHAYRHAHCMTVGKRLENILFNPEDYRRDTVAKHAASQAERQLYLRTYTYATERGKSNTLLTDANIEDLHEVSFDICMRN